MGVHTCCRCHQRWDAVPPPPFHYLCDIALSVIVAPYVLDLTEDVLDHRRGEAGMRAAGIRVSLTPRYDYLVITTFDWLPTSPLPGGVER